MLITMPSIGMSLSGSDKNIGYNLVNPDVKLILPNTLQEISGLVVIDSSTFACIQDEKGIIFIYDFNKKKIIKQYDFHIDGDYEGIALVDKTIYILRSDGILFEIIDYKSKNFRINKYSTGIPAKNNEGLCYDRDKNRLLIGCKSNIGKGPDFRDVRAIYGFDLYNKSLTEKPVFVFEIHEIMNYAQSNNILLSSKAKKKGKVTLPKIKFRISAICIHPVSKRLYLLSAVDHLLFIFDMNGKIKQIEKLNPVLFNKAEGISFFDNGNMIITNEGQNRNPTVLRFSYKN
jgi:uncharacterized protein YjiK